MSLYIPLTYQSGSRTPSPLGLQFQQAREALGLSQEQLAEKAGVGLLDVKAWETGPQIIEALPSLLEALKATFHVSVKASVLYQRINPEDRLNSYSVGFPQRKKT